MFFRKMLTALAVCLTFVILSSSAAQASVLLRVIGNPNPSSADGGYWINSNETVGQKYEHSSVDAIGSIDFLCASAFSYDSSGQPIAINTTVQVTFWEGIPGLGGVQVGIWNVGTASFCKPGNSTTTLSGPTVTLKAGISTIAFHFGEMGEWSAWGQTFASQMATPLMNQSLADGGMQYLPGGKGNPAGSWSDTNRSLSLRLYSGAATPAPIPTPNPLSVSEAEAKAQEVLAECASDTDCSKWGYLIGAFGESSLIDTEVRQCIVGYLQHYGPEVIRDADLGSMADDMQYTTRVASDLMNWYHQQLVVSRIASLPFPSSINIYDATTWSNPANRAVITHTILATGFQSTLDGIATPFKDVGLDVASRTNLNFLRSLLLMNDSSFNC